MWIPSLGRHWTVLLLPLPFLIRLGTFLERRTLKPHQGDRQVFGSSVAVVGSFGHDLVLLFTLHFLPNRSRAAYVSNLRFRLYADKKLNPIPYGTLSCNGRAGDFDFVQSSGDHAHGFCVMPSQLPRIGAGNKRETPPGAQHILRHSLQAP